MKEKTDFNEQTRQARQKVISIGLTTGIKLAIIYVFVWLLFEFISEQINNGWWILTMSSADIPYLYLFFQSILIAFIFGSFWGSLSAGIFGILTGIILSKIIVRLQPQLSIPRSLILGTLYGLVISTILFTLFGSMESYWLFIGRPSIVYIIACGWMSMKFYQGWVSVFMMKEEHSNK